MKKFCAAFVLALSASSAFAGGLLTNTNQNAAFLRQMSQNGIIDITGLYVNPAGTAFLEDGWHLSLNNQAAWQTRSIETSFPLFAMNTKNNAPTHKYEGKAMAPAIPSFQLSYNHDKWSVNANFALVGGGGKCEFEKGLGSFEALYAGNFAKNIIKGIATTMAPSVIPGLMASGMTQDQAQVKLTEIASNEFISNPTQYLQGYELNTYMKGRQYYFGLTLGATYKVTDYLAVFGGIRGIYGTCNYNGYVSDVKVAAMGAPLATPTPDPALTLNCDQSGFGIAPILGFDCKINDQWNVAVKYEFSTIMKLKNSTQMNDMAKAQAADPSSPLAQFKDGEKVREDIPAILTVGAQYNPLAALHLNAGVNYYFDKQAKKYGNKQDLLDDNTLEITAGVEYDLCKLITVSASWQNTNYGQSDAYMNDLSFNLSSNSLGCGLRINATERCSIDLGYMHTFYQDRTVNTATAAGTKTDLYHRENNVIGVGVNLNF